MKLLLIAASIVSTYLSLVDADCYGHTPRCSNNRLNERRATRQTNNRVFDSQNNNRGGYNIGDLTNKPAGNDESKQYQTVYYMSPLETVGQSVMPIEWTTQHGCGGNDEDNPTKCNCNLVIQMKCQPHNVTSFNRMRDGTSTNRNEFKARPNGQSETYAQYVARRADQNNGQKSDRALHEEYQWYDKCNERERNKGLFTADQNLNGNTAKHTRQNPNGNRNGYECPEERDYYPYWHPTPWKDLIVVSENKSRCDDFYRVESFNVAPKYECVEKWVNEQATDPPRHYSKHNNEQDCVDNGGNWTKFHNYLEILSFDKPLCESSNSTAGRYQGRLIWGRPMNHKEDKCLVKLDPPECIEAPYSRVNSLGNGAHLEPLHVYWKIPGFPSQQTQKCVIRIRYNITTDDYDPYRTDSNSNGENSPVKNDPLVDIGLQAKSLRLAINTAQFGRTFQDRTHIFKLVSAERFFTEYNQTLYTVQVRGKRGNIVQTFPAVEYDFFPTDLVMKRTDILYFTWTGSNTHNNQPPGGDGQTGDAGQGTRGTDRNNVCGLDDRNSNFALPFEHPNNICQGIRKVLHSNVWYNNTQYPIDTAVNPRAKIDACIQLMSSGYYWCYGDENTTWEECRANSLKHKKVVMSDLLNNSPATFKGIVVQMRNGTYHYMSSRNNQFTNRSQKATIIVL